MKTGIVLGLSLLTGAATGCTAQDERIEAPAAQLDLRAAMGTTEDLRPVGLAIAPDGQRFVFEETGGLFRLDGTHAIAVVPMSAMPSPEQPVQLPFTDIVALAPNLFALTAIGDGFLLDTQAMTLRQHFCYLPDGTPVSLSQRTDGIAFDAVNQRLFAQPVTYDAAGVFQYAQLAVYARETGQDVEWHSVSNDVAATGMVSSPEFGLLLGQGSQLSRFDPATEQMIPLDDLHRFGVRSIDGLSIDQAAGTLVVVDKVADAVFDLDLSTLAL